MKIHSKTLSKPWITPDIQKLICNKNRIFRIKNKNKIIPAAVHVDGTSRIHTVSKSTNPRYWNLINEFRLITSLPMILNTSFNRHGIATISEPRQAIEHLLDGCMDYLAINDFLISFNDNRIAKEPFKREESEEYSLKKDCILRLVSLLHNDKKSESIIEYVKKLSEFLKLDLTFDGKIFKLEDKNILQKNIEENLLEKIVIFR